MSIFRVVLALVAAFASSFAGSGTRVEVVRIPGGGIQPQAAVDPGGALHLIYLKGEPGAADIYYVRRSGDSFSPPLRVNSRPGSSIAAGTVRGPHLALGKGNRVHVAWMGSRSAKEEGGPFPMLYTRSNPDGTAFEPERNVLQFAVGLDGGASLAADPVGNVYVAWHAGAGQHGEAARRVWVARSRDEGRTFEREGSAWEEPTGACACCGMRAFADSAGRVYMLYRAAREEIHRPMYLLFSKAGGEGYRGRELQEWTINACPMSTASLAEQGAGVLAAWETAGQVYFARIDARTGDVSPPVAPPGGPGKRKHPSVASNARGEVLLVWTEGTGWNRGGSLAWQLFDSSGRAVGDGGHADGVPTWSLGAATPRPDGSFLVAY